MSSRESSFVSCTTSDQNISLDAASEPESSKRISQGEKNNLLSLWNECPAGLMNVGEIHD